MENAATVEVAPNVLPSSTAFNGCLGVAPREPTTYTLTAFGSNGNKLQRSLTVKPQ